MDTDFERGTRLMIELCNGRIYEGVFYYGDNMKISVVNVMEYPNKTEMPGLLHFFKMEILSITVLDEPSSEETDSDKSDDPQINTAVYDKLKELAYKYTYLAVVDSSFHDTINYLKICNEISVIGFGNLYGRNSKISVLGIGTKKGIILFDIKISGSRAFKLGLRDILEDEDITKIVHNSKILADCLHHCYDVSLKNVFDTQVADYMITQKNENCFPEKMKHYADCVQSYLKIPANIIKSNEVGQKQINERPLSDHLKLNASLQVAYLSALKNVLNKNMLHSFYATTECFLNCMKYEDPAKSLSFIRPDVPEKVKDLGLTL